MGHFIAQHRRGRRGSSLKFGSEGEVGFYVLAALTQIPVFRREELGLGVQGKQ